MIQICGSFQKENTANEKAWQSFKTWRWSWDIPKLTAKLQTACGSLGCANTSLTRWVLKPGNALCWILELDCISTDLVWQTLLRPEREQGACKDLLRRTSLPESVSSVWWFYHASVSLWLLCFAVPITQTLWFSQTLLRWAASESPLSLRFLLSSKQCMQKTWVCAGLFLKLFVWLWIARFSTTLSPFYTAELPLIGCNSVSKVMDWRAASFIAP